MRMPLVLLLACAAIAWFATSGERDVAPLEGEGTPIENPAEVVPARLATGSEPTRKESAGTRTPVESPGEVEAEETSGNGLGSLVGNFLFPAEMNAMNLVIEARWPKEGKGWASPVTRPLVFDSTGTFKVEGVPPGEVRVVAERKGLFLDWELKCKEDVLEAGETLDLGTIDLRDVVWLARIQVVDGEGRPIEGSVGTHNAPENEDIEIVAGKAQVTVSQNPDVAWFGAPGYQAKRVDNLLDGTIVVLEPAPQLSLELENPEVLPMAPWSLQVQIQPNEGYDNWIYMVAVTSPETLVKGPITSVSIPRRTDNLIARWRLVEAQPEGRTPVEIDAREVAHPTQFSMTDPEGRLSVRLNAEAIQEAVASAETKREAAIQKLRDRDAARAKNK